MKKKLAVVALIYQDKIFDSKILCVSRKTDSTDFGLPGGKLEENETLIDGLKREVKEETGLNIEIANSIFAREDDEYIAVVFLISKWHGEISTSENGKVEWLTFNELKNGSFGEYNSNLENHIDKLKQLF